MPKILLIDDDHSNLNLLFAILHTHDPQYDILKVNDPEVALKNMGRWMPDLVITDWNMPKITGLELIQKTKKISGLENIPFIMVTGVMTKTANQKEALNEGAVYFMHKPIDAKELKEQVQMMLNLANEYDKMGF
ncbi:MAG: response regulator [Bacteroidota bacterium]